MIGRKIIRFKDRRVPRKTKINIERQKIRTKGQKYIDMTMQQKTEQMTVRKVDKE